MGTKINDVDYGSFGTWTPAPPAWNSVPDTPSSSVLLADIGILGPHDKLLIVLKTTEHLELLDDELQNLGIGDRAIIFSGDVVESLTIVQPEPLDTDTIVEGSRTILKEMSSYDSSSGTSSRPS